MLVRIDEKTFYDDDFKFADNSLFEMFTLPFLGGNPAAALSEPDSVVVTEEMARRFFGDRDPIGSIINISNDRDLKVTGVIKNPPSNSTLRFSLIATLEPYVQSRHETQHWGNHMYATYIQLDDNASLQIFSGKISDLVQKHLPSLHLSVGLSLQPLSRIYLYEEGHIKNVKIFSAVAVFMLLIAFINFINLQTARSENRAREVGVRKVIGANRLRLIRQFLSESVLFSVTAFLLSVAALKMFLPLFNTLTAKQLTLDFPAKLPLLLGLLGVAILVGMAAGSYPALYLSSFQPVNVLRKIQRSGTTRSRRLRTGLVIFQFSLSVFLIISTLMVYAQLRYIRNKDVGYGKEHVVYMSTNKNISESRAAFVEELKRSPGVFNVSIASSLPSNVNNTAAGIDWEGNNGLKTPSWWFVVTDYEYDDILKLEMAEGRWFSQKFPSDLKGGGFIVNEEAAKEMGLKSPVGKWFSLWGFKGNVIGVVKNFHIQSLHSEIDPMLFFMSPEIYSNVMVRIAPGDIQSTIRNIKATWQHFAPNYPFEYGFLDASFDRLYRSEEQMGRIFSHFTFLAVFVSCLGLFGLAAYTAELRTKEIGIRKVFGASASNIVFMMSSTYTRWILLSNLIAWPAAYFFINQWLRTFAYRAQITVLTFALSAVLSIAVALITVSFQAFKAAVVDPIDSLRYE